MDKSSNNDSSFDPQRIRGLHRRRVLSSLSRSDMTVAEISRFTNLRMPHVSAELRRLRREKLVDSASTAGTRGASIHLTPSGRNVVIQDIIHRAQSCLPIPSTKSDICLVSKDRDRLVLASTVVFNQLTIAIPDRQPTGDYSSGNQGAQWILAEVESRDGLWINPHTGKIAEMPDVQLNPNSIESFSEGDRPVYVFNARMIGEKRPISLAPGTWFTPRYNEVKHPFHPQPGFNLRIGTLHEDVSPVYAPNLLIIDIEGRMGQLLIARTIPDDYLMISSIHDSKKKPSSIPEDVLDCWIELAHPRTKPSELRRRSQALKDRILLRRRSRVPEETLRRFRADWGNSQFEEKETASETISTKDLGIRARKALIKWVLQSNEDIPVAIEVGDDIPEYMFKQLLRNSERRIIFSSNEYKAQGVAKLSSDTTRPLPWARYTDQNGIETPIRIDDTKLSVAMVDSNPRKEPSSSSLSVELTVSEVEDEYISLALNEKNEQDDYWANLVESEHPEAALIATPRKMRWNRWKRIKGRVDQKWMDLVRFEDVPDSELHEFINISDKRKLPLFSEKFSTMVKDNPNFPYEVRPLTPPETASSGAIWIASRLLASAADISPDMTEDLRSWAIPAWLSDIPDRSIDSLSGAYKIVKEREKKALLDSVHIAARDKPNSDLHTWSRFVRVIEGNGRLTPSFSVKIVRQIPMEWFAPLAEQILLNMLKNEQWWNNAELCSIPWAALALRPSGEPHHFPGSGDLNHPGPSDGFLNALEESIRYGPGIEILDEASVANIHDLIMSMRNATMGLPPYTGRTHPLVGWLAQPLHKWPEIAHTDLTGGDPLITARLLITRSRTME